MKKEYATIVGSRAFIGRTQYFVKCVCSQVNTIPRSTWSTTGWYKCKGCGKKIAYVDREILPPTS